jgi:hypothetical protein
MSDLIDVVGGRLLKDPAVYPLFEKAVENRDYKAFELDVLDGD